MKRWTAVLLLPLLMAQLLFVMLPTATAAAAEELSWQVPYGAKRDSVPPQDKIAEFLGFERSLLHTDGALDLKLLPQADGLYQLQATIKAGEQQVTIAGNGTYGPFQGSPLQSGEFKAKNDQGAECTVYVSYYPRDGQIRVTIVAGQSTLFFGQSGGNIDSILLQVSARSKRAAQLAASFTLDGQPLIWQSGVKLERNLLLVPVRQLFQALGARVDWDAANQRVVVTKGSNKLLLTLGGQDLVHNGSKVALTAPLSREQGVIYGPLDQLANILQSAVIARKDGQVNLVSAKRHPATQGLVQVTFSGQQELAIKNDSDQAIDLGGWQFIFMGGIAQECRLPAELKLQPEQQLLITAQPDAKLDQKLVFGWSELAQPADPSPVRIVLNDMQPGSEHFSIQSHGEADLYIGNWRLASTLGKPELSLAGRYLTRDQALHISGTPGLAQSSEEVRWPNLPAVEAAYQKKQADEAAMTAAQREQCWTIFEPLVKALAIDRTHYLTFALSDQNKLLNGELPPLLGQPEYGGALLAHERGLLESQLVVGDKVPAIFLRRDGLQAYIGLIKADGSMLIYNLHRMEDAGFKLWSAEKVEVPVQR